jgi:hypothetical protein
MDVAEHAREAHNYTAQDAVRDFLAKPPPVLRVRIDVCRGRTERQSPSGKVIQNGTELGPSSLEHSPHGAAARHGRAPAVGEHSELEFEAAKIESAPLTNNRDRHADGQHDEATLDLAKLK